MLVFTRLALVVPLAWTSVTQTIPPPGSNFACLARIARVQAETNDARGTVVVLRATALHLYDTVRARACERNAALLSALLLVEARGTVLARHRRGLRYLSKELTSYAQQALAFRLRRLILMLTRAAVAAIHRRGLRYLSKELAS